MINNLSNFLQANLIFYLLYFTLLLSSSLVFLGKNVKFSAIFLMLSFLFASFLLLLSGSEFIGLLLIVVYVGAISILFLFAIMLTESKATDSKKNSLTFAAPTGVLFCTVFYISVWLSLPVASYTNCHYSDITNSLILVNKFIMAGSETNGFGNLLYSYYALHILILGILLLAILLGVFRLTNSLTSFSKIQFTSKQLARSPANFMRTYKPLSFYIIKLDSMGNFGLIEEEGESMLSNYLPDIKNEIINFKNYTYESYKIFFMRTFPLIFSSPTPMPAPAPTPWLEIDLRPIPKCPCPYKPSGFGCPCPLLSDHTPCLFKSTYIPNPESRCRLPNDDSPKLPDFIIFPPQIEKKEDVFIPAKQVKSKVPQIEVSKQQKKNKGSNTVRVVHRAFSTGSSSSLHDSSIESFSEPVERAREVTFVSPEFFFTEVKPPYPHLPIRDSYIKAVLAKTNPEDLISDIESIPLPEPGNVKSAYDYAELVLTHREKVELKLLSIEECQYVMKVGGFKSPSRIDPEMFIGFHRGLYGDIDLDTVYPYRMWEMFLNFFFDHTQQQLADWRATIAYLDELDVYLDLLDNINVSNLIHAKNFAFLAESFLGLSILFILISVTWLYSRSSGFILQKTLCEMLSVIMLFVCYLHYNDLTPSITSSLHKSILSDEIAKLIKFALSLLIVSYFLILSFSFKEQSLTSPEYVLLLSFSILGLLLVCSCNDLLTIYLSLELISLSSYYLSAFKKSQYSCESGLKYFITGSLSSAFFIFGSSLIYLETNSINLSDYTNLCFYIHPNLAQEIANNYLIDTGLSFIFFSLCIKLICAPFHLWSLDVYEESPTSSSFYFATITKLSLFIVLVKVFFFVFFKLSFVWVTFFTVVGMTSAFIGALGGLRQKKFKTLLAYSSITNMGYALIVLGGFSDASIWAMLIHVIVYQFAGLCVWSLLIITQLKNKREKYSKELNDMSLLKKTNLSASVAFALTLFSIAGIPPLLGFVPKIFIISEILRDNLESAAVFLALCSVVATFYYIRIIKIIFFENILVGKLYLPSLGFYSIVISCLIHNLLYAFIDTQFLTTVILGISSRPLVQVTLDSIKSVQPGWRGRLRFARIRKYTTFLKGLFDSLDSSLLREIKYVQRNRMGFKFLCAVEGWVNREKLQKKYLIYCSAGPVYGRERQFSAYFYYETFRDRIVSMVRMDVKLQEILRNCRHVW